MCAVLAQLPKLQRITLREDNLGTQGCFGAVTELLTCAHLSEIDLSTCGARDEGAAAVARLMCVCRFMQRVILRDNGVTNIGARALAAALWCSSNMTQIDLTNNSVEDEGCTAFAECLQYSCTSVSSICLELNPASTGIYVHVHVLRVHVHDLTMYMRALVSAQS